MITVMDRPITKAAAMPIRVMSVMSRNLKWCFAMDREYRLKGYRWTRWWVTPPGSVHYEAGAVSGSEPAG